MENRDHLRDRQALLIDRKALLRHRKDLLKQSMALLRDRTALVRDRTELMVFVPIDDLSSRSSPGTPFVCGDI
jgi:hypothetical protein